MRAALTIRKQHPGVGVLVLSQYVEVGWHATARRFGCAVGHLFTGAVVSGTPTSLVPSANFDWLLLRNPGLISIPSGFLCGLVGTLISKEAHSAERYDELSVRAFTGAGAEKAVVHQEHLTSPGVKFPLTGRIAPP